VRRAFLEASWGGGSQPHAQPCPRMRLRSPPAAPFSSLPRHPQWLPRQQAARVLQAAWRAHKGLAGEPSGAGGGGRGERIRVAALLALQLHRAAKAIQAVWRGKVRRSGERACRGGAGGALVACCLSPRHPSPSALARLPRSWLGGRWRGCGCGSGASGWRRRWAAAAK
jgi:hypothetical protein